MLYTTKYTDWSLYPNTLDQHGGIIDNHQKIIAAASDLINERGVGSSSTKLIAKTAGVSTGTLFHYFPTKQDLVKAVYYECLSEVSDALLTDYSEDLPLRERFLRYWINLYRYSIEHPRQISLYLYLSITPHIETSFRDMVLTRLHPSQKKLIEDARREKVFKDLDAATVARIIHGGIAFLCIGDPNENPIRDENHIRQIIEVYWDGITR